MTNKPISTLFQMGYQVEDSVVTCKLYPMHDQTIPPLRVISRPVDSESDVSTAVSETQSKFTSEVKPVDEFITQLITTLAASGTLSKNKTTTMFDRFNRDVWGDFEFQRGRDNQANRYDFTFYGEGSEGTFEILVRVPNNPRRAEASVIGAYRQRRGPYSIQNFDFSIVQQM